MNPRPARCPTCGAHLGEHGLAVDLIAGDPSPLAATILRHLRHLRAAPAGLAKAELYRRFGGRVTGGQIGGALVELYRRGLAWGHHHQTGGRSAERWRAINHEENT
jgi:hypothetical protein